MQLQTLVDLPSYPFSISHQDKLSFIGSCFADNMGQKFSLRKFNSLINPYGTLYNPASVAQCIVSILNDDFDESQIIEYDGIWHSFSHHGSFSNTDKKACIEKIMKQKRIAKEHLIKSNYLFLTFGTAHIFEYDEQVVSNCHKLPAKAFTRRRLSIKEISDKVGTALSALRQENPEIKVILTLSPVRYAKDGMHTNSLSKATLLLAIEKLCQKEDYYYFPAYEIVIDELRDYRFYSEDMAHVSPIGINYLWEKIEKCYFSEQTLQLNKQINKLVNATEHRPFNTKPEAHQQFLLTMLKKASDLQSKHPELDLSEEIAYFSKNK